MKVSEFEKANPKQTINELKDLALHEWLNRAELDFLAKHNARYVRFDDRHEIHAVRIEMLIDSRRVLCFEDCSLHSIPYGRTGYNSVENKEFCELYKNRLE